MVLADLLGGHRVLAIAVGFVLVRGVLAADQGTPKMIEIAEAIQEGAMAYLRRQFRTIAFILVPVAVVVFVDVHRGREAAATRAASAALRSPQSGIFRTLAFVAGCVLSGAHRLHRHEPRRTRQRPHRRRGPHRVAAGRA